MRMVTDLDPPRGHVVLHVGGEEARYDNFILVSVLDKGVVLVHAQMNGVPMSLGALEETLAQVLSLCVRPVVQEAGSAAALALCAGVLQRVVEGLR